MAAGPERLDACLPDADDRTSVSGLLRYLRCRQVREDEALAAVLKRVTPSVAEKFIQEVYRRSDWKR